MARIALVVVCLMLLGVWVHPYMSAAFERRSAGTERVANVPQVADEPVAIDQSPIVVSRGVEGFWRLGKAQDGTWWFLSPDGKREFLNTVTTVQPFQLSREANGVHFVSRDYNGTVGQYDGDLRAWAEKTLARVKAAGFKGIGAWSHPVFHELDVPISRDLNIWKHFGSSNYKLYSSDWESFADGVVARMVVPLRDNRNLVGYYLDNELDWSDASVGPSVYFDSLSPDDPNRQKVIATIQQLWPTIEDYNRAWGSDLVDYSQLATLSKLPREPATAYAKLFNVWLEQLAGDYFRVTTALVRKHDPNHLILGVRFAGYAPPEVVRASRNYTDAQSINYYVADGLLDPDMFGDIYANSGQPVLVTEYAFHALDGRSGNRNTFGFHAQVADQQARADGYKAFTTRMARVPYIVGADWFQWSDEPAAGRSADGEDVNFGIVDIDDKPYEKLVDAIRATTPELNIHHARSATDTQQSLWRQSFTDLPTAYVPRLEKPIRVNGNLSDWSERNRLTGVRVTESIGHDRYSHNLPAVYLGWRDEGLYVAVEVYDSQIETIPATERWWTRDNVEFWVSTRPVSTDQQVYNAYCHQFFFIPNANPVDGVLGTVGQWHRPGDALQANLIPHPQIVQQSRVLPDRYTVEMFIPAKALYGWDPTKQNELAFNIHVRNFHQASDFFWSAPKEAATQLRPNTWGKLVLTNDQFVKN